MSSDAHPIVNQPKTNQLTVNFLPTPIDYSLMVKSEGLIAGEMAKMKKLLN